MNIQVFWTLEICRKRAFMGKLKQQFFSICPRMPAWHPADSYSTWSGSIKTTLTHCGTFTARLTKNSTSAAGLRVVCFRAGWCGQLIAISSHFQASHIYYIIWISTSLVCFSLFYELVFVLLPFHLISSRWLRFSHYFFVGFSLA